MAQSQSATPPRRGDEHVAPSRLAKRKRALTLRHPRGRIAPPLPRDAPRWRRLLRSAYRVGHGLVLHDALMAAPAMAFHFFLSLLPLLVFVGYVVGSIARTRGVDAVLLPVLDNLPSSAGAIVKKEIERLAGGRAATLGPLAAVGFLWLASGGTHGLINAIENLVGAPRRPWWKKRLLSLAWVVAALAAFALASLALVEWDSVVHAEAPREAPSASLAPSSSALRALASASVTPSLSAHVSASKPAPRRASSSDAHAQKEDRAPRESPRRGRARILRSGGERALALALTVLFASVALAAFYRSSVSHSRRVVRRVLPGAALAVVLWFVISWAFGLYVTTLAGYAVFYGSLAAVAVLLVWLWLTSLAILAGAELNSQLEGIRD